MKDRFCCGMLTPFTRKNLDRVIESSTVKSTTKTPLEKKMINLTKQVQTLETLVGNLTKQVQTLETQVQSLQVQEKKDTTDDFMLV